MRLETDATDAKSNWLEENKRLNDLIASLTADNLAKDKELYATKTQLAASKRATSEWATRCASLQNDRLRDHTSIEQDMWEIDRVMDPTDPLVAKTISEEEDLNKTGATKPSKSTKKAKRNSLAELEEAVSAAKMTAKTSYRNWKELAIQFAIRNYTVTKVIEDVEESRKNRIDKLLGKKGAKDDVKKLGFNPLADKEFNPSLLFGRGA